ncbi:MAG: exported protein of unknown function [Nitrospira sp.]
MKRASSVAILFVCVVWVPLLVQVRPVDAAGDASKGKPLYEKHCLVCHGLQGKGDGPTGTLIKPPAANFTSEASKKKTEAELLGTMENGRPGTAMGPWKGLLSPSDLRDVLAYVMALRK